MDDQPNYPFWFCMMAAGAKSTGDLDKLEADPNYALALLEAPGLANYMERRRKELSSASKLDEAIRMAKMTGYMK